MYKKKNKIEFIPSNLEVVYKNRGWQNYRSFFGTNFWSFKKARNYVRSLNLKNTYDWREFAASEKRIKNIPSNPWAVYKEWVSIKDWIGL